MHIATDTLDDVLRRVLANIEKKRQSAPKALSEMHQPPSFLCFMFNVPCRDYL
jgi:hypothetical protein